MTEQTIPQWMIDLSNWMSKEKPKEKETVAPWVRPEQKTGIDYLYDWYSSMFDNAPAPATEQRDYSGYQPNATELQAMQDVMKLREQKDITAQEALDLYNKGVRPEM